MSGGPAAGAVVFASCRLRGSSIFDAGFVRLQAVGGAPDVLASLGDVRALVVLLSVANPRVMLL